MKAKLLISLFLSAFFVVTNSFAAIYDELSPEEQEMADSGEQVVFLETVPGGPWPKINIYQVSLATADEIAAVFFDYENHKAFFPGIIGSHISKRIDSKTADVDYIMTFPKILGFQLKDENYTTRDVLSSPCSSCYDVEWTKVRADSIKQVEGSMRVEPHRDGAILAYYNYINPPKPELAKLIVQMFVDRMKETARALDNQVQKEKKENPALLKQQIENLRNALR
ncbi:MAG: hypothetical protein A3K03_00540 [Bdellovibrionales bacterium RIFOXYD1_FULL_44_7]|nr:MAG: hypothetical protein A3K03_00540 [Bdellovibrionales bacterium RIFOXYD1_FULL_44_7]